MAVRSRSTDAVATEGWAHALLDARAAVHVARASPTAAAALLSSPDPRLRDCALEALSRTRPQSADDRPVNGSDVLWVLPLSCVETGDTFPFATVTVRVVNTSAASLTVSQPVIHLQPTAGGRSLACRHAGEPSVVLGPGESDMQFWVSEADLSDSQPGPHVVAFLSVTLSGGLSIVARPRRWLPPAHRRGEIIVPPPVFDVVPSSSVVAPARGGPQPASRVALNISSQEAAAVDVSLVLPHAVLLTQGDQNTWQWIGVRVHVAGVPLSGSTLALSGGAGLQLPLDQPAWVWRQGQAADTRALVTASFAQGTLALPEVRSDHALVVWLRIQVAGDAPSIVRIGVVVRRLGFESMVHMFATTLSAPVMAPFVATATHTFIGANEEHPRAVLHVRLMSQLPYRVHVTAVQLQSAPDASHELAPRLPVALEPGQSCGFLWALDAARLGPTVTVLQVRYTHDMGRRATDDAGGADLLPPVGSDATAQGVGNLWNCRVGLPRPPAWKVACYAPQLGSVGQRMPFRYTLRPLDSTRDAAPAQGQALETDGLRWRLRLCALHWIPLGPTEGQLPTTAEADAVIVDCAPLRPGELSAPQLELLTDDVPASVWHVPAAPQLVHVLPAAGLARRG